MHRCGMIRGEISGGGHCAGASMACGYCGRSGGAFWKQRVAVVWEVILQDGIIGSACCWIRDGMVWG